MVSIKAWVNGKFQAWDQVTVPLLSHSFGRGSAVFDVVDIVISEKGPAYFRLKEHIDRFFNSARLVSTEIFFTKEELTRALIETARLNNVREGFAKLYAYYPLVEFSLVPKNRRADVALFCIDFAFLNMTQDDFSGPVSLGISTWKKLHPETVPVEAKVVGNYVNPYLAKLEVTQKGYDDAIMVDTFGRIAEGALCNIFFASKGEVKTPRLGNILSGITRRAVIEVFRDIGIPVEETHIHLEDLAVFEEAFCTSSVGKIQPVKSIEGEALGGPCPGPITKTIVEKMKAVYGGKIEKFEKWLTYIM
jgi:branched-chain amino acid aminotransferase